VLFQETVVVQDSDVLFQEQIVNGSDVLLQEPLSMVLMCYVFLCRIKIGVVLLVTNNRICDRGSRSPLYCYPYVTPEESNEQLDSLVNLFTNSK
jgi:hypothetical protein